MPFENKKQLFIILGALALGLVAVFLASNYVQTAINNKTQALAEQYASKEKEMVSAIQQQDQQQMAQLAQEMQREKSQEEQQLKTQIAALKISEQQISKMRPQTQVSVKKEAHKPSLALRTPVGMRAVTVKIDSLAAVGGMINPGDFVDVIGEMSVPSQYANKQTVTAMVFQDLQVLAVNTNEEDLGDYDKQQAANSLKITFAVSPQEAGLLEFADKNGKLDLALRSPDDMEHRMVKADTWKTLADYVLKNQGLDLENPDEVPTAKPEESKPMIQIFRGGREL
ncbi:MAG: Flp pilus assembly protein CpaB [Candidatus Omnitrophica bacterium]|nr:Flp pilus assembly protein CpaB [Candidatus Omnitrophota bacterium]MDE2009527.1 Flp pilus assembly protein CpaB [Candidatus Omnitrophota bacterium]MDE2214571.1 Flp pilus assembly protein CpaB [Candidatus Omnitrophota bacterium]MDE2231648.1 Flp pilus assembly protein CpaB [Candidatus Omnitrophota bacterium]